MTPTKPPAALRLEHAPAGIHHLAAGLQRTTDFEWVSRLRYYWRDGDMCVDMVQVSAECPRHFGAALLWLMARACCEGS